MAASNRNYELQNHQNYLLYFHIRLSKTKYVYVLSFKKFPSAAQFAALLTLLPWAVAPLALSPSYAPDSEDFFFRRLDILRHPTMEGEICNAPNNMAP
jgi:hypothetical protein